MPDEYRFTILVEKNGVAIDNMPLIRRYVVAEDTYGTISQPADNNTSSFHPIASLTMPNLEFFMLTMDQAENLQFNLNTAVPMDANGVVLFLGCTLTQGTPTQNIEINNPAASTAANVGVLGGGT